MRGITAALLAASAFAQQTPIDYQRDIHPVLATKCFACHGGDKRSGGLSLKDYTSTLEGGRSGAVIVPGVSAESLLMSRVTGELKPQMPPAGAPLSQQELGILRAWIDQGARSDPTAPAAKRRWMPPLELTKPSATPPAILAAYFKANNVPADARISDATFARRAYLDIWGLTPSPEQLREFLTDTGTDKRARLVRQLLAHGDNYAGHWMTFWNDLLRNEDAFGIYGGDRKSISPWLEKALRDNLPFDQFLEKLLNPVAPEDPHGFIVGVNWRGDSSASQMPWIQAAQNSAQVFLGINLKCNSCHDSFISRWKLKDAYGLAAYFSPEAKLDLIRCDAATGEATTPHFLYKELDRPAGQTLDERHAAVAQMFLDRRNGRTPRTIVNRIWAKLLGRGIVEPLDDMDAQPWSPELLDSLAADFAEHSYDLRYLIGTIMLTDAYQMPSIAPPQQQEKNYVFRGPAVRRLTAEQFIDSISAITGEWPVLRPRTAQPARYVREARLMSSPLTRALGRPIRDQVVTERSADATTLQMLELVNGPDLYKMLYRGARKMLGQEPLAPDPLFDSGVMRGDTKPKEVKLAVPAKGELYLVVADEGSYYPDQTKTIWEIEGLGRIDSGATFTRKIDASKLGSFQATVRVNPESHRSDINPAVRFFVFAEKPNPERLVPILPQTPVPSPQGPFTTDQLAARLFRHALGRDATPQETRLAREALGPQPTPETLADLLWSIAMTTEFQLVL